MDNNFPIDLKPLPTTPYDERPDSVPLDVEEVRTALWIFKGNVTEAAARLKVTSLRLRNFIRGSARLTAELRECNDQLVDIAREVVAEALTSEDDSRKDTMARFVLTNLGAEAGFGAAKGKGVSLNLPSKGRISISWADGPSFDAADTEEGDVIEGEVVRDAAE